MIKSLTAIRAHRAFVALAFERYGEALIKASASLFDPKKPALFRQGLKLGLAEEPVSRYGIENTLRGALRQRVYAHDFDKMSICGCADRLNKQAEDYEEQYIALEARYRLHDAEKDHHATCWVIRPRSLNCASFIEHLLDHAAINIEKATKPFTIDWLYQAECFSSKRNELSDGTKISDIDLLLNTDSFVIEHAVKKAVLAYRKYVQAFDQASSFNLLNGDV
jgi:hypothetical protein